MIVIHVARKPLSEPSVASNVIKHGTGGINVDRCRTGTQPRKTGTVHPHTVVSEHGIYRRYAQRDQQLQYDANLPRGRWPANIILEHRKECQSVGFKRVKPSGGSGIAGSGAHGFRTQYIGGEKKATGFTGTHVEADGFETVEHWRCDEDCPVVCLDRQSGILTSGRVLPGYKKNSSQQPSDGGYGGKFGDCDLIGYGDQGGASRFFKQVKQSFRKTKGENDDGVRRSL